MRQKFRYVICAASLIATATSAGAAGAKGCNGVVNQLVWGCAAWDNNNGPQYPNYRAPTPQASVLRPTMAPPTRFATPSPGQNLVNRNGSGVVNAGGGNVINAGGANLRSGPY